MILFIRKSYSVLSIFFYKAIKVSTSPEFLAMAWSSSILHAKLVKIGLASSEDENIASFEGEIDVLTTIDLHLQEFEEHIWYMQHIVT